jgi:hypothetical protein
MGQGTGMSAQVSCLICIVTKRRSQTIRPRFDSHPITECRYCRALTLDRLPHGCSSVGARGSLPPVYHEEVFNRTAGDPRAPTEELACGSEDSLNGDESTDLYENTKIC